jgi:hypothetical protein
LTSRRHITLLCALTGAGCLRPGGATSVSGETPPGFPPSCAQGGTALQGPFALAGFKDWGAQNSPPHFPAEYFGGIAATRSDGGRGRVLWSGPLDDSASSHSWGLMAVELKGGQLTVSILEDAGVSGDQIPGSDLPEALPPFITAAAFVQGAGEDYVWGRFVYSYEPLATAPVVQLAGSGQPSSYAPLPVIQTDGAGPPKLLPWCTQAGDFNGDGQLDLLECYQGVGDIDHTVVALGDGTGHFFTGPTWDLPYDRGAAGVGRWLDQPGSELLIPNDGGSSIVFALADGGPAEVATNLPGFRMWAVDLNGDGLDDAVGGGRPPAVLESRGRSFRARRCAGSRSRRPILRVDRRPFHRWLTP